MNKKIILILIIIIVAAAIGIFILRGNKTGQLPPKNAWVCENGQWIKAGNPTEPMPSESCPVVEPDEPIIEPELEETPENGEDTPEELPDTAQFTMEEVAKHNSKEDCWLLIDGKIYDVTNFIASHPGGNEILAGCGKDATELFETRPTGSGTPHSENAREIREGFYIGDLIE